VIELIHSMTTQPVADSDYIAHLMPQTSKLRTGTVSIIIINDDGLKWQLLRARGDKEVTSQDQRGRDLTVDVLGRGLTSMRFVYVRIKHTVTSVV